MSVMEAVEQAYGEVFTKRWVVETLLDLTGYTTDRDLTSVRLVEPSCGTGAFVGPIVERLLASASLTGTPLGDLGDCIRAYDLKAEHVAATRSLVTELIQRAGANRAESAGLAAAWVRRADFLIDKGRFLAGIAEYDASGPDATSADVVVGNPPYIRYDDIDPALVAAYRMAWPTMTGRGDAYIGFYERSLGMLTPGGKLGFICADRWMRNQYGADLRDLVTSKYAVEHVWTMHDVDAFEAQVSAYPAITVLGNHTQGAVMAALATSAFDAQGAKALVAATAAGEDSFSTHGVTAHRLPHWFRGRGMWPTGTPGRLALIEHLNDNFAPLNNPDTGTKVSIGVATGADKAFITRDRNAVEPDRLLPLAMRVDLASGQHQWQGYYLINPWDADGTLINLGDYPRMAAHLANHPDVQKRFVAKKNPSAWYRTIDKVTPGLQEQPKLLLQDMKTTISPVLEAGGCYPHHGLYYVTSTGWDIEVLGGLLLSRIAQAFIEAYGVKMRGGTLRFQAQYLKLIRVPDPATISGETQEALRAAFRARDADAATEAAASAYGISLREYDLG